MLQTIRTAAAIVTATAALGFAASAAQAGQTDFTLYNQTDADIYYLFVSPDTSDDWGYDVLGEAILPAGGSVQVGMDGYGSHCTFDIQVEYHDGQTFEMWGVDLCTYAEVVVE
ncbi:MAG: hypothetical protein R3F55_24460 [Alphaproteobacteria bacterium]